VAKLTMSTCGGKTDLEVTMAEVGK